MSHVPVFKKNHFECSVCGLLWPPSMSLGMVAEIECVPKVPPLDEIEAKGDALFADWRDEREENQ